MVIFGISVSNSLELDNFIYKTNNRFENVVTFYGTLTKYKDLVVVDMKPLIVPFFWFGLLTFFTLLYFFGFNKFSIFSLMIFSTGIFWTKYFFYMMLKIGLKKEGHKGKIRLLSSQKTLEGVLYGTTGNNQISGR